MQDFITESSGNVYQDLGFKDADGMKAKAKLVHSISKLMEERHLTQREVSRADYL